MIKDFEFNGTSLVSKRWRVQYIPEGLPAKRGNNIAVPYSDGERWAKKLYDKRKDILNMYVFPFNASGTFDKKTVGETEVFVTPEEQVEINVEYLKSIFGVNGLIGVRKKMASGIWRKAYAEIANAIEIERKDGIYNKVFSVELTYPDPFWYSETLTTDEITPDSAAYTFSHTNDGTAEAKKMQIILTGSMVNPKIENLSNGVFVKLNETITSGKTVTIDTENFTVVDDDDNNLINSLIHSGDVNWLTLKAGANNMKITCDATPSGTCTLKYYPHYF